MGDRANIIIKEKGQQVCLYSHWGGTELPHILKSALIRGKSRWNDYQYLNRIIFCEMVGGKVGDLTGYGISQNPGDGDDRILYVDTEAQTVAVNEKKPVSFTEYINTNPNW